MEHLDITLDFETCALSANAAVIQLGAVAWNRHASVNDVKHPFGLTRTDGAAVDADSLFFNQRLDLTDQVFKGREFNAETVKFWAEKQKDEVKRGILAVEPMATADVLYNFVEWVKMLIDETGAKSVCLWAQGTDFDIAILRSLALQFNVELPRNIYKNFRDARTFIMENGGAVYLEDGDNAHRDPNAVYQAITDRYGNMDDSLPDSVEVTTAHDALYDSLRSSWNVWLIMQAQGVHS